MGRTSNAKAGIARAAFDVLAERGLDGATFGRIAERARCAKGLVNYHFPSRFDLFAAVVSLARQRLWDPRVEAVAGSTGTAVVERAWKVLLAERGARIHLVLCSLASLRVDARIDQAFKVNHRSGREPWDSAIAGWLERSRFRTDSQVDVSRAVAAILEGFAGTLADEDPDDVYPAFLTAWIGLTAALAAGRS